MREFLSDVWAGLRGVGIEALVLAGMVLGASIIAYAVLAVS